MKKAGLYGTLYNFSVGYGAISAMMCFSCYLPSVNSLSCISMNNQACKSGPEIININIDNPIFYPFCIKTSKCIGNCNNINDPYAKICVPVRC